MGKKSKSSKSKSCSTEEKKKKKKSGSKSTDRSVLSKKSKDSCAANAVPATPAADKKKSTDAVATEKKSKKSKSSKASASKSTSGKAGDVSTSLIGGSKKPPKSKASANSSASTGAGGASGGKSINGNSTEVSTAPGRPMLCQKMQKVLQTVGAIKLKSMKEMKEHGYEIESKVIAGQETLRKSKGPHGKVMACKVIDLSECTARYKITMDLYSLRVMRFIGKKPLVESYPRIYEVFMVRVASGKKGKNRFLTLAFICTRWTRCTTSLWASVVIRLCTIWLQGHMTFHQVERADGFAS